MQSQFQVDQNPSLLSAVRRSLAPTGGAIADGTRLATINALFIVGALAATFIFALVAWLIRFILPLPHINPGLMVLGLSIVFALVFWYRYAKAYGQLAQASGNSISPNRFGLIAGAPFGVLALFLLASGVFGLAISAVGLDLGRANEAAGRIIFAMLFGALAFGSVLIARIATRGR